MEKIAKKDCVIVVPIYKKNFFYYERYSIVQINKRLFSYDRFIVAPDEYNLDLLNQANKQMFSQFQFKSFDKKFFQSAANYNNLCLEKFFYEAFINYDYMLICQIDALVFSNSLLNWCRKGYDYIGAPWFFTDFFGVGNGGFSLRKVESCIKVLDAYHNLEGEAKITGQEDGFWGLRAKKYYPNYKVASIEEAVHFSFETRPVYCYHKTHYKLPFGCHRWMTYGRYFWLLRLFLTDWRFLFAFFSYMIFRLRSIFCGP